MANLGPRAEYVAFLVYNEQNSLGVRKDGAAFVE